MKKNLIILILVIASTVILTIYFGNRSKLKETQKKHSDLEMLYTSTNDSLGTIRLNLQRYIKALEHIEAELMKCKFKSP